MFSCATGREEHCKQISLVCVGSACSVWATLGLPPLTACVLSPSTLLRLLVALQGNCLKWALSCVYFPGLSHSCLGSRVLHKGTDSVGRTFCALPRPEQLRRPGALSQVGGASYHLPVPSPQVLPPPHSQPLGFLGTQGERRLRWAVCLLWGADL